MDIWQVAVDSATGRIYLICEQQNCLLNMSASSAKEIAEALQKAVLLLDEPKSKLVN